MGKILHAFLPATEEGNKFIESITITNRGGKYSAAGNFTQFLLPQMVVQIQNHVKLLVQ